jgi:hypothetical protein
MSASNPKRISEKIWVTATQAKGKGMTRFTVVAAAVSAVVAASTAIAQVPAGWKVIKEDKGKCQMSVPSEWKQGEIMGQKLAAAESPDNTVDSVVSLMDGVDWTMFNQLVFQIYKKEKDRPKIESGPKRLWFEIDAGMAPKGKTGWYVAVPGKAGACNAQVNFKKGDKKAEETARKIAESIRSN